MTVVLKDVTRVVGAVAHISEVSLTLEPGTLSVLLGPTLSGKTSLMRLLAGLDVPTAGRVVVNGKDVTGIDVRKRSVAMVYQQFVNYPSLTRLREHRLAVARRRAGPTRRSNGASRKSPPCCGSQPYLERAPLALSGGQQQRTAIARALVKGADLVLLDEPLANLDYKLREELRTELPRIFAVSGAIFVYATTEPSEALLLGGRTICMSEGRALQVGDTPSVYRRPDSIRVAELFSDPPLNTVQIEKKDGVGGLWRRRHGARQRPLRRAGRRTLSRRLPRPPARRRQRRRPAIMLPRDRGVDGNHRLGKLRAPQARRHELGRRRCPASMSSPPARRSRPTLDPNDLFVFAPDGRLVAAPGDSLRSTPWPASTWSTSRIPTAAPTPIRRPSP